MIAAETDITKFHSCNCPLEWTGCYNKDASYAKYITPESYTHPAKMSWGLLEHIFKHLQELNLITLDTTVVDFMSGCYDSQTEVLTEAGWKFFDNILPDDKICTLNPLDNFVEYHLPLRIIKKTYRGKMYYLSTKQINLLVTPDHNLYVAKRNGRKKREEWVFSMKHPNDVFGKPYLFKKNGIWKGKDNPEITDTWLKFLGIWLAEGCICRRTPKHRGYDIFISHTKLLKEIKQIVEHMGYKAYISKSSVCFSDKELYDYLKRFGHAKDKYIPAEIKALPPEKMEIFLDWYLKGDGHIGNYDNRKTDRYACWTSSINLRDDLQEMALKVGWSANYYLATPKGDVSFIGSRKIKANHDNWAISFNKKQNTPIVDINYNRWKAIDRDAFQKLSTFERWIDYDGCVYCVEVPNHIIYIRRNGKPIWCGNSGRTLTMAELFGYKSIGIELEPHFIKMIADNKAKVEKITGRKAQMEFMQGDARQLSGMLKEKGYCGVVSPPFADTIGNFTHERGDLQKYYDRQKRYNEKINGAMGIKRPDPLQYSTNPNNIGNLKDTPLVDPHPERAGGSAKISNGYGVNPENLGNQNGSTYLEAMFQVYSEAYLSGISPLVLVTKNPTRNGKLRRLDLDTIKIITTCHHLVYCNCESNRSNLNESIGKETYIHQRMERSKSREGEEICSGLCSETERNGEIEFSLHNGKSVLCLWEINSKLGGKMQATCPYAYTQQTTYSRGKGKDKSKKSIAKIHPRTKGEAEGNSEKSSTTCGEETKLLYGLWQRDFSEGYSMPEMLSKYPRIQRNDKEPSQNLFVEQRKEIPTGLRGEECDVERGACSENNGEMPKQGMAENTDGSLGDGQIQMPDVRGRGIYSSPQKRMESSQHRHDGRCNIPVSEMPLQSRSATDEKIDICPKCGKWKIPEGRTLDDLGYEIFDYHRAILFKEVTQGTIDGKSFTKPKGRLSFFKRLSYDKGNIVARWEDVIFARISNQTLGTLTGITSPPYSDQNAEFNKPGNKDKEKFWEYAEKKHKRQFTEKSRVLMETPYSLNSANIGNLPDKPVSNLNHEKI